MKTDRAEKLPTRYDTTANHSILAQHDCIDKPGSQIEAVQDQITSTINSVECKINTAIIRPGTEAGTIGGYADREPQQ